VGTDDKNTLPVLMEEKLKDYSIKNFANFSMADFARGIQLVNSMKFNSDDIIVFGSHSEFTENQIKIFNGQYINLQKYYDRPHNFGEIFTDMTHMNQTGYKIMVEALHQYMSESKIL
jgi:lysophospholipase L1-like esterase